MTAQPHKDDKVLGRTALLTPRCLGIVLKEKKVKKDNAIGEVRGLASEPCAPGVSPSKHAAADGGHCQIPRGGRDIFESFLEENEECYWNPELEESIHGIKYMGVLLPCTLIVGGRDEYLDTLREAWARKIIKPPPMFVITKIGDIDDIAMQVIPQTQFTPLPDALCLIISDLEKWGILATFEEIQKRLCEVYRGMHQPPDDLIYETLATLMKEGKVFHRGPGYGIITPDMLQFGNCPIHDQAFVDGENSHFPTLYIPMMPPAKSEMVSISCQTQPELSDNPNKNDNSVKENSNTKDEKKKTKLESSSSMRIKSKKDKEKLDSFGRSGSLRYSDEKGKALVKDINLKTSDVHQDKDKGDNKPSLLSKIFGRSKKKTSVPEAPPPEQTNEVEYATFSAQFPPPEWSYYQQQIETYVKNAPTAQVWNYMHGMVADADVQTEIGDTSVSDGTCFRSPVAFDSPHASPVHVSSQNKAAFQESTPTRRSHRSHKHRNSSHGSRSSSREVNGSPYNGSPYRSEDADMVHQQNGSSVHPARCKHGSPAHPTRCQNGSMDRSDNLEHFARGHKIRQSGQWSQMTRESPELVSQKLAQQQQQQQCEAPVIDSVDEFRKHYSHLEKEQNVHMRNVNTEQEKCTASWEGEALESTSSCTSSYPQTVVPAKNPSKSSPAHYPCKNSSTHQNVSQHAPVQPHSEKHQSTASPSHQPDITPQLGDLEKRPIEEPSFLNNGKRKSKHLTNKQKIYRYKEMHCPNICKGDISIKYQGKAQRKTRDFSKSCDSGVNCIGLSLTEDQSGPQNQEGHNRHSMINALVSPDREYHMNTRIPFLQDISMEDSGFNSPRTTELSDNMGKLSILPANEKAEANVRQKNANQGHHGNKRMSANDQESPNVNHCYHDHGNKPPKTGQSVQHKSKVPGNGTSGQCNKKQRGQSDQMTRPGNKVPPPNSLPCHSVDSVPGLTSSARYPSWGKVDTKRDRKADRSPTHHRDSNANVSPTHKQQKGATLSPTHQACLNINLNKYQRPDDNTNHRHKSADDGSSNMAQNHVKKPISPVKGRQHSRSHHQDQRSPPEGVQPTPSSANRSKTTMDNKGAVYPNNNVQRSSLGSPVRSSPNPGSPVKRDYQVVGMV